jgi:ligand-binding sensor domain-containing protein
MKFSGTRIKSFTSVGKDDDAISSLEMHSVIEDKCGFIWIGTTGGLDKLDPVTDNVTHYTLKPPNKESASIGYIYAVFQDSEEFIWVCSDMALFKLDNNTGDYQSIPIRRDQYGIPNHTISYNGFIDSPDGIWFQTADGLSFYEYKTDWFYHRYHNPNALKVFDIKRKENFGHSDIEQDSQGRIWFVNNHNQLTSYHPGLNQIDSFEFFRAEGTWPCCYSIAVDARDNIWVGTRHGGVFVLDTKKRTFRALKRSGINRLIQSDYIYCIERGNDDRMFVSHDNGLDIIDLYDESIVERKLSSHEDFLNLKYQSGDISFIESEENVYIPFYTFGFFEYNLTTDAFIHHRKHTARAVPASLVFAGNDYKYVSTAGNIYSFDTQDGNIRVGSQSLLPDTISKMGGQVIWYFRENPTSVYFKKSNSMLFHWQQDTLEQMSAAGFKPNACISRDSQYLYYVNYDDNLVRRTLSSKTNDTIDLQQMVHALDLTFSNPRHIVDDGSSIWMTSQTGILRYAYDQQQLTGYTMQEGLSHGFNFAVVTDKDNNVWVGNLGGIDRYDPATKRFVSILKIKETSYMDAFGHAVCTDDGKLIFHFGNKLYIINPENLKIDDNATRQIQLNEVRINGNQIDWRNPDILPELKYHENRISFTYDVLEFADPDLFSFQYRIDGREWIENRNRGEVNFDGLASGHYVFEVKTAEDSFMAYSHRLSVPFTINPPFWKTWWFILLNVAFGMFILRFLIRKNVRRIRAQNKVALQMAELKSTALRAQMNPHFIFNCLNAIQECVVTGQIDAAYTYLSKFSRLLRLILEHSDRTEIVLFQEMEMLDLYMTLEKVRFKGEISYTLHMDTTLDPEDVVIPSMMIQPHLENAIVHGLRTKTDEKVITVCLQELSPDYVSVVIEDNGIGLHAATQLKVSQLGSKHRHKSKGLEICTQRIAVLRETYPKTEFKITDRSVTTPEQSGTRIALILPILTKSV